MFWTKRNSKQRGPMENDGRIVKIFKEKSDVSTQLFTSNIKIKNKSKISINQKKQLWKSNIIFM